MENKEITYIDLAKYIQGELGENYIVLNELDNNVNNYDKTHVIVKALASQTYSTSAELKYQLNIFTNDPQGEIDRLTLFAKNHNQTIIDSFVPLDDKQIKLYKILQNYTTPTIMESDLEGYGTKPCARLVMFVDLFVMEDLEDIVGMKIDNEIIDTRERSINYVGEIFSNRESGKELNANNVKSASVGITFLFINKQSIFNNKLSLIRQGKISKNTSFKIELIFSNSTIETYNAKLQQMTLSSAFAKLPSNQVSFIANVIEEG